MRSQLLFIHCTPIAFDERVTFWLQRTRSLPCVCAIAALHCMRVRLHNGYKQAYVQIMQHTHTHKAVTGCVEAKKMKKLLSHRRQSNYSSVSLTEMWVVGISKGKYNNFKLIYKKQHCITQQNHIDSTAWSH